MCSLNPFFFLLFRRGGEKIQFKEGANFREKKRKPYRYKSPKESGFRSFFPFVAIFPVPLVFHSQLSQVRTSSLSTSELEFPGGAPKRLCPWRRGGASYSSLGFTFPRFFGSPQKKSYLGVEESYRYRNQLLGLAPLGVVRIQAGSMGAAWGKAKVLPDASPANDLGEQRQGWREKARQEKKGRRASPSAGWVAREKSCVKQSFLPETVREAQEFHALRSRSLPFSSAQTPAFKETAEAVGKSERYSSHPELFCKQLRRCNLGTSSNPGWLRGRCSGARLSHACKLILGKRDNIHRPLLLGKRHTIGEKDKS